MPAGHFLQETQEDTLIERNPLLDEYLMPQLRTYRDMNNFPE